MIKYPKMIIFDYGNTLLYDLIGIPIVGILHF